MDVAESRGADPVEIGRIATSSGDFAYEAFGPGDGELVMCAHGFPDHPRSFRYLARALAREGRRVIVPWMRGYAPSTRTGPFHLDRIADDLVEIATALSPSRPSILVGHDWGACAAYVALARHPARFRKAVTLAVPHPLAFLRGSMRHPSQLRRSAYMAYFNVPGVSDRGVARDDFAFIDRLWRIWSPGLAPDPEAMQELKACLARSMPAPILYYRALPRWRPRRPGQLARITVPTLYLHGADDGCVAAAVAEGQERYFNDFRGAVIPASGHFLHLEAAERIFGEILAWLA
jgi:pimeloyl-ACP methyl ester carboxylesterase